MRQITLSLLANEKILRKVQIRQETTGQANARIPQNQEMFQQRRNETHFDSQLSSSYKLAKKEILNS